MPKIGGLLYSYIHACIQHMALQVCVCVLTCCGNGLLQENGDKQKLRKEVRNLATEVNHLRAEVPSTPCAWAYTVQCSSSECITSCEIVVWEIGRNSTCMKQVLATDSD